MPRCASLARAERAYAKAHNYEQRCRDACVDLYFETARLTAHAADCDCMGRARQLHEAALMKLVVAGQRFKRLDPTSQALTIHRKGHKCIVPIVRHGFLWDASEFQRLVPIGYYETNSIRDKQQVRGLGVPFVVEHRNPQRRQYVRSRGVFPATLVLHCDSPSSSEVDALETECRLELYDPLRVDSVDVAGCNTSIAKDTTAPIVYALQGQQWSYLNYFINPGGASDESRLFMLEPYQPNKIPLVLIHGLLSDPFTWVELINELLVHPGFLEHYQVLSFEYSTGNPFLRSATTFREQFSGLREHYDPRRSHPHFSNTILVGHSMGGLIAKLQVTSSGDQLWNSIANRPLDELRLPEALREGVRELFYFQPSPDITRVVFMATPHRGSSIASGPVGTCASRLVNMPEQARRDHALVVNRNPGVFSDEFQDRVPTSIDMLNPHSRLLEAIEYLPTAEHVCLHSILGNSCYTILQGRSDGIVPVSSAREPRAVSQKTVRATHSGVKAHPEAIKEVLYILQAHLQESYGNVAGPCCESERQLSAALPSAPHAVP